MYGRFCIHQGIIYVFYKCIGVNFPPITVEDKFSISKLVLGDKAPSKTFYEGLIPKEALHQQHETHPIYFPITEINEQDLHNTHENKQMLIKSTPVSSVDSQIPNTQDSNTVLEDINSID